MHLIFHPPDSLWSPVEHETQRLQIPSSVTHSQRGTESESQSCGSMLYLLYLSRTAPTYQLVTKRHKTGLVKTSVIRKVSILWAPPHTPCKIGAWISNHLRVYPEKINHLMKEREKGWEKKERNKVGHLIGFLLTSVCYLWPTRGRLLFLTILEGFLNSSL